MIYRHFMADTFLICMIQLVLTGGSHLKSAWLRTCSPGWNCTIQILAQPLTRAGQVPQNDDLDCNLCVKHIQPRWLALWSPVSSQKKTIILIHTNSRQSFFQKKKPPPSYSTSCTQPPNNPTIYKLIQQYTIPGIKQHHLRLERWVAPAASRTSRWWTLWNCHPLVLGRSYI